MERKRRMRGLRALAAAAAIVLAALSISRHPNGCSPSAPTDDVAAVHALVEAGRYAAAESLGVARLAGVTDEAGTALQRARLLDAIVLAGLQSGKAPDSAMVQRAREALRLKEEVGLLRGADLVPTLNNLATAAEFAGDFNRARPLYERALEVARAACDADHPDVARLHYCYGAMLAKVGEYAAARAHLEAAIASRERYFGIEHPEVASALNTLGALCHWSNDFVGARRAYSRCLAIRERVRGPNHPEVAGALNNLAAAAFELGDYAEAQQLWTRALAIREASLPRGHPRTEGTRANLARAAATRGDLGTARRLYAQAIATIDSGLPAGHPLLPSMLHEAAATLLEAGDTASTRPYLERALELYRACLPPHHPDVALCLRDLARLEACCGNGIAARARLDSALAIQIETYGENDPQVARTQCELAQVCARLGEVSRGLEASLAAEEAAREHLRLTARSLSEYQALRYEATRAHGLDVAIGLGLDAARGRSRLDGPLARCWDVAIRSRSLVLDELAARQKLATGGTDSISARLAAQLGAARRRLANLIIDPPALPPQARRALVDSVARAREAVERQLATRSALFRAAQARDRIGLQEVAACLGPNDALLGYVVHEGAPRAYAAFLLRGPGRAGAATVSAWRLGRADSIEAAAERWMQEVRQDPQAVGRTPAAAEAACRRRGEALRALVWDPMAADLRRVRRLFVVPDGVLQLLNLAALPAASGGYLVERDPLVHLLSTERDLVPVTATSPPNAGLLALGGPDFDAAPAGAPRRGRALAADRGLLAGVRFAPLPAAEEEAAEIMRTWQASALDTTPTAAEPRSRCLLGRDASEDRFKQEAPGKQVLHLATHGFFLEAPAARAGAATRGISRLVQPAAPRDSLEAAAQNPLLRAGLAFAGANAPARAPGGEDGILTAEEIAGLDLRGVEWAVLSACDTGLGAVRAREGIFGLRRAFQIAGVRTVIASLWAVRDDRTRTWMTTLYRARAGAEHSTAAAVRDANVAALAELRTQGVSDHPYSWAGFVAVGE